MTSRYTFPSLLVAFFCAAPANVSFAQTGDFNQDGAYDCLDIDALGAEIVADTNDLSFDLDGDGIVNHRDLDVWLTESD